MKRIMFVIAIASLLVILPASCGYSPSNAKIKYETCAITDKKMNPSHTGLPPLTPSYTYHTSCGHTLISTNDVSVGDTIEVKVYDMRK